MQNKKILNRMKAMAMSSVALAGVGVMPSMTVFAAPLASDVTITVNDGKESNGSVYVAYRLMDLTTKENADAAEGTDKYSYRYDINNTYGNVLREAMQSVFGKTDFDGNSDFEGRDIQRALTADGVTDAQVRAFADKVYTEIVKAGNISPDETANSKVFSTVNQGYYLIVEQQKDASPDAYSLVMLDTLGQENITVNTKEDVPTLKKELKTGQNGGETKKAGDLGLDASVNTATFVLTGTMPENLDAYEKYQYRFHDKLSAGLKFKSGSVVVKVDGNVIDASKYTVEEASLGDACSFHVSFADIKAAVPTITKDSVVVVEYDATLTDQALIGAANENTAKLEFSNDPYWTEKGETGDEPTDETPEDKTYTFTYKLVVDKVNEKNDALAGAEFELSMLAADGKTWTKLERFSFAEGSTKFTFERLDSGTYKITEVKAPDGYIAIDPITFTIAGTVSETTPDTLGGLTAATTEDSEVEATFTASVPDGQVSTIVKNEPGKKLPSTGGAGTTMLYVGGGIMVAGGLAVLLVSKKKKENE